MPRSGRLSAFLITLFLLLLLVGPAAAAFVVSYGRAVDAVSLLDRTARESGIHESVIERLARLTHIDSQELRARGVEFLRDGEELLFRRAMLAVGNIFSFGVSVCIFLVACFFFLKDGRSIIQAWEDLTPLDVENDRQIRREFAVVCRAVVSSTFLAALAQAGPSDSCSRSSTSRFGLDLGRWLALLTLLVLVFAMIPLLGAPVVWVPLAAWLLYREDYTAGVLLALIGALGIGSLDNLVRMFALRGSTGLHPLLALVSVLGGIQWMGVVGAFHRPGRRRGVYAPCCASSSSNSTSYTTPPPSGLAPVQWSYAGGDRPLHGDPAS